MSHALRNALIPTVTVLGLTFANLLAGAVLTETIFSWPGIGQYAARAALRLDYPALLGVTLTIAFGYIVINLIVDISYGGVRFEIHRAHEAMLPASFSIKLPSAQLSVQAKLVWKNLIGEQTWLCGASLSQETPEWYGLVDAI